MYTFEIIDGDIAFKVYDPEGKEICDVYSREEAEAVVSHLNRGNY